MKQTTLLARAFFARLFESDLMPAGLPQVQLIIWGTILIATPALTLPGLYSRKYTGLWFRPGTLSEAMATDRLVLITFAMMAVGFVALIIWEGVFPDRRDARILGVLPVRNRTFIAARLCAMGTLFAIFFATIGAIPSLTFGGLTWSYGQVGGLMRGILAHFVAVLAATVFVFSGVIALQCLLINLLGRATAQRVAVLLQILFSVALVEMVFFLPSLGSVMRDGNLQPDWLSSSRAEYLPSVWFLAIYEVLTGFGGRNAFPLAAIGATATVATLSSSLLLYAVSYSRMSARALETSPLDSIWSRRFAWLQGRAGWRRRAGGNTAVSAAVRSFTLRTLFRSRQHRMLLALYLGFGLAIVISAIVPTAVRNGFAAFRAPGVAVLAAPLVLMFFVLVGMRVLFAIPVEPKANWIVKLRHPQNLLAAIDGVRNAMLLVGVAPAVAGAGISACILWGLPAARIHTIVTGLLGWLLVEMLLVDFVKVPFTCTYLPGRSRVTTLWPAYMFGFITYTLSMAQFELQILRRPSILTGFCLIAGTALVALTWVRARALEQAPGLRFEEEDPEKMFDGFRLSEGVAASARPAARVSEIAGR